MLHLGKPHRAYPPETVAVMTTAFDTVCQSLSTEFASDEDVRREVARIILRHVDGGVVDPALLSRRALAALTGTTHTTDASRS